MNWADNIAKEKYIGMVEDKDGNLLTDEHKMLSVFYCMTEKYGR